MRRSQKALLFFILWFGPFASAFAQGDIPMFGKQKLINGFKKELHGESIPYFSVFPKYAKEALLTRTTDGTKSIEWMTDVIPPDTRGDYAYFTWIAAHSSGTSGGNRQFDLFINDEFVLTFTTTKSYPPYWTFGAADSTRMVFELKTKDGASDSHGMMYLRVPLSKYPAGSVLKLKVVGRNQQSNDWYMTFKYAYEEKIEARPLPFVLKDGNQPIRFIVLHFGSPDSVAIRIGDRRVLKYPVVNGFNVFDIPMASVSATTKVPFTASVGKIVSVDSIVVMGPVADRELNLVHHSHTDIGYSHIQEDVIRIHTTNVRRAMKLIEKTKDYPEGSKFVWNIESAWAIENFFDSSSAQERTQLINYLRNGNIALAGTYANVLTGLALAEELSWNYEYAAGLRERLKIPVLTGMMTDIPGMSWSTVNAMAKNGVRYFSNGPNYIGTPPYMGDRIGTTLMEQGNKAFWWKTVSGQDSVLFWTCGQGYSSWHGVPEGGIWERGEDKIADYMNELDSIRYPYSIVHWRYNIVADNGPVDSSISDYVKNWNEKYLRPRLVLANVNDMFSRFEKAYGSKIPVLSGDFTPYWEDGAYSTAKEEGEVRLASQRILQTEKIARQEKITLNPSALYKAKRGVVLFQEHTWGAFNSVGDPENPFVVHQWNYKKSFLDSALFYTAKIERELASKLAKGDIIRVYNTTGTSRSGYVEIDATVGFKANVAIDEKGNKLPLQHLSNGKWGFIASGIPAHGVINYKLAQQKNFNIPVFATPIECILDNENGGIKSVKTRGREWVNNNQFKCLMQGIYVKGLDPSSYTLSKFRKIETVDDGPVRKTVRLTADLDGANEIVYEVNQYNGSDILHLAVIVDKKAIRDKEALHIAFPFAISSPEVKIGIGDTYITPEKGAIPGSNKDFYSVQRWIDVSDASGGVTIVSPQGALWEVGRLINEEKTVNGFKKWETTGSSSADIFLYAMNNYWHTNYKADQSGKVRFDFYLSFHGPFELKKASEFGYDITEPLRAIY
jgi:hypothetical protein